MENPKSLRKKFSKVLLAAVCGAVFFDLLIVLVNVAYSMGKQGHLSKGIQDFFSSLAWTLVLPTAVVSAPGSELANPYVVDGLLGAIIFGSISAFWQFVIKGLRDEKKSQDP